MSDLLELTVAAATAKIASGYVSAAEYLAAWTQAAAGDELNAYLWTAEGAAGEGVQDGPLSGIPVAVKDIFCTAARRPPPARGSSRATSRPTRRPR